MAKPLESDRPSNREVENEMIRIPERSGEPPRPATEPPKTHEPRSHTKNQIRRAEARQPKKTEVNALKANSKSTKGKLQDPETPKVDMGQGSLEEQPSGSKPNKPHHRIKPRPDR